MLLGLFLKFMAVRALRGGKLVDIRSENQRKPHKCGVVVVVVDRRLLVCYVPTNDNEDIIIYQQCNVW